MNFLMKFSLARNVHSVDLVRSPCFCPPSSPHLIRFFPSLMSQVICSHLTCFQLAVSFSTNPFCTHHLFSMVFYPFISILHLDYKFLHFRSELGVSPTLPLIAEFLQSVVPSSWVKSSTEALTSTNFSLTIAIRIIQNRKYIYENLGAWNCRLSLHFCVIYVQRSWITWPKVIYPTAFLWTNFSFCANLQWWFITFCPSIFLFLEIVSCLLF